ncbi:MAG: M48 family metalloprotease [Proteobacteria bacterium]|nr:M48 family metalloprotease [Pseudomonadota bacterium]
MNELSSNSLKVILLLAILSALALYFGNALAGQQGVLVALGIVIILNLGAFWGSDKVVLALYKAKEITQDDIPMLYATVAYLAERAKISRPRIYLIEENTPNAFALGRGADHGTVVVTKGLLGLLNKDELAGVIAHEIAHIEHRDTLLASIAASIGGAIALLANLIQSVFIFGMGSRRQPGNNKLALLLLSMVAPMLAMLIQMTISREREFAADEKAAALCENPQFVANALRKLEKVREQHSMKDVEENPSTAHLFILNPLRNKKWKLLFSSHPPIGARVERLECMSLN